VIRTRPDAAHNIPTQLNAAIILAQIAALAACYHAAAQLHHPGALALLALAFGVLMNSVYSIIHEAEHAILFPNRRANEAAGMIMALFFPAPFHLLRQGHIGHHLRNRSDDEAFDLYFEGDNVIWKWMVWLGILTGLYYLLVVLSNIVAAAFPFILDRRHFKIDRHVAVDRASAAFFESFNPAYLGLIRLEGIAAITLHTLIVWRLHIPLFHYLAMYGAFGFMWSAMQYVHHYATERHVTRGARNLWLFGPVDLLWLNHNWHRAHHEHPTLPWIHLPHWAREDAPQRRAFLPLAYLKMWKGPRQTHEHVQNKYAGRIIQ
jgi:fatty acid desaturase